MMLGRVMREPPDFDLHIFMCSGREYVRCVAIETSILQASRAQANRRGVGASSAGGALRDAQALRSNARSDLSATLGSRSSLSQVWRLAPAQLRRPGASWPVRATYSV